MSSVRSSSLLRIVIGVVATIALLSYLSPSSPAKFASHLAKMASSGSSDPIPGLTVTLAQVPDANPPSFRATITNNNPRPVCVLTYGSPLDKLAVALGAAELTPAGAGAPIDIDRIMVNRVWPPKRDSVIEIAGGGGTVAADIPVKPAQVPYETLGGRFAVQMKGEWMAVLDMPKSEVTDEFLRDLPAGGKTYKGKYVSDKIEMVVDTSSLELK